MPTCDIIIPVYNNARSLEASLMALCAQELPATCRCSIIIVDDGSTDRSGFVIKNTLRSCPWAYRLLSQAHGGAAAARNQGLKAASGDLIFFLGADIVLRPGALRAHLTWHEKHPAPTAAALGLVRWDPRVNPSPLMEWMTHGGSQNEYDALLGVDSADPRHFFYGSQLSLKRSVLPESGFCEKFGGYGWEDVELGRRLAEGGLHLQVLHNAVGLHQHYYSVAAVAARQRAVGRGLLVYQSLYPREHMLPSRPITKKAIYHIVWRSKIIRLLQGLVWLLNRYNRSWPRLFSRYTALEFWIGTLK